MKTIHLHHPYQVNQIIDEDVVLALGFFDGVHKGHQEVIKEARRIADEKGVKLALMSFNRHPAVVFERFADLNLSYLSTPEQKEKLVAYFGVDILYQVDFTSKFGALKPQEFVDQYIVGLNAVTVVAGSDYTYGKKEVASIEHLPKYAKDRFEVVSVDTAYIEDNKIASSQIKEEVKNGAISLVNKKLGYCYSTPGFVINGESRGREMGYPTANIQVEYPITIPNVGIYAVKMTVEGKTYSGMASIGYNLTFGELSTPSIEVNIFDFNEYIYGENVIVHWIEFMRDEVKFESMDALIKQLEEDEVMARRITTDFKGLII